MEIALSAREKSNSDISSDGKWSGLEYADIVIPHSENQSKLQLILNHLSNWVEWV